MQNIAGHAGSRDVLIDGEFLDPEYSQSLRNHSPDGFSWGYGGSGPSQLALAILLRFTGPEYALAKYHDFKFEVIAALPTDKDFVLSGDDVRAWVAAHPAQ